MSNPFIQQYGDSPDAQAIARRQKMAESLLQQSQQDLQGQTVSGHYIPPSWSQQLAQVMQAYKGNQGLNQATEDQKALAEKLRGQNQAEMGQFTDLLGGKPAQTVQPLTPNDDEGNVNPAIQTQAQAPDLNQAYKFAASAQNPALQQFGMQGMMTNAETQAKLAQALQQRKAMSDMWSASGGDPQKFMQLGGDPTFAKQMAEAPNLGKEKGVRVGESLLGEFSGKTIGTSPNPNKPFNTDGSPNQQYQDYEIKKAHAGKPQVSVDARNFNTQESEQSKAYGKTLGEMRGVITQSGFDAPKKIMQLDRMEQLIGGLDAGGKGAPLAADVASYAASMGIKLDPKLGAKEAAQALAIEMAGNMRAPGTGPMTDKDFDNFLRRVPDLSKTPEGRKQITGTMRAALQRDLEASKFARDYAKANGGVIDDNFYDAMAGFYNKNPVVTPELPNTNARGKPLPKFEDDKESRYQEWKRTQGIK